MTGTERDRTLDSIKGVAIFLVMLGHVINLNHMEDGYLYDFIKAVQMPLFIMVSGYLCGMGKKVRDWRSYGDVLKKRACSYLVPFFVWILLLYPLELPGAVVDTLFHLDYGLWFLMTLFLLTVMVYTAQRIAALAAGPVGREVLFWGTYGLLAAFVVMETFLGWEFLSPELTRLYIPFYMAGYGAAVYGKWLGGRLSEGMKNGLAILACGLLLWLVVVYDLTDLSTPAAFARQMAASFAGCFAVFRFCRLWPENRVKSFAAWLGGYTLEIYAVHFHFAALLNRGETYQLFSLRGMAFAIASFAVMSAITAGIIFVTKKVRVLDFLLYGKRSAVRKEES